MKFTREIVEKVFENLGKTPESIREFNDANSFDVDLEDEWGESLRVVIYSNNRVEFTTALDYKQTFDADDLEFFNSINVSHWEIYKHWIKFEVDVKDEKELEAVARKVIDKYFD